MEGRCEVNCTICGHRAESDGQLQCDCSLPEHSNDANKKVPWADQPTPLTDADELSQSESEGTEGLVSASHARDLERRMRAAERLLESKMCRRECGCCKEAKAHLEAAQKEDWK